MGDMRASDSSDAKDIYTLWPWIYMLDEGERIKVITPVECGMLEITGTLACDTENVADRHDCVKVTFDMSRDFSLRLKVTYAGIVVPLTPDDQSRIPKTTAPWSGVFIVDWSSDKTRFGLHADDVKATKDKAEKLSMLNGFNPVTSVRELDV